MASGSTTAIVPPARDPARCSPRPRTRVRQAPTAWTERARRECAAALSCSARGCASRCAAGPAGTPTSMAPPTLAMSAFAQFDGYLESEVAAELDRSVRLRRRRVRSAAARGTRPRRGRVRARGASDRADGRGRGEPGGRRRTLPAPDWRDALARLADAHPTTEQFYGRFDDVWSEARAVAEAHDLLTVPDWPVRFAPQPALGQACRAVAVLHPVPLAGAAGSSAVRHLQYIPTIDSADPAEQERRLRATNDQVIKQNYVVHHAGIGHHAQNWYAMRAASRIGQIAAVDCASRIAMLCGGTMAEGWASYATDLMDEVGFLTPLESFAQQYARLRMAARTVVDVRLHDGRFSLEDGAAFLPGAGRHGPGRGARRGGQEHPLPGHRPACTWPAGTASGACVAQIAAREGSAFSLRRFHDRLLVVRLGPGARWSPARCSKCPHPRRRQRSNRRRRADLDSIMPAMTPSASTMKATLSNR